MMNIEQKLIADGWKRFTDTLQSKTELRCVNGVVKEVNTGYYFSYQKRIDDDKGKKYFVNAHLCDWNLVPYKGMLPKSYLEDFNVEFDVQFTTKKDETFNVKYFEKDIPAAMAFFEKMWRSMGCEYYEEWDY